MSDEIETIVQALKKEVHREDGWLSDAQDAQLYIRSDGNVSFCGEGSIDLHHIAEIAFLTIKK